MTQQSAPDTRQPTQTMTPTDTTDVPGPNLSDLAIVKNAGSSHFSAVDLANREVVADLGDGKYPHTVVFHPDGRHALLLYISSAHLEVVDLATMETVAREDDLGTASIGSALSADGQRLFITTGAGLPDADEPGVVALSLSGDPPTPERIGTRVVSRCTGTTIGPDGRLYVGEKEDGRIAVLSADDDLVLLGRITVGEKPHDMYPVPGTDLLAVNNAGESFTSFVDVESGAVTNVRTGENPHGIAFAETPDGRRAFVPAREDDRIAMIDLDAVRTGESGSAPSTLVDVGTTTGFAATTADGRYVLVDSYDEPHVTIVDTDAEAVVARVHVGGEPLHVVTSQDSRECYVGNMERSELAVLDVDPLRNGRPEDVRVIDRIGPLGSLPSGIFRPSPEVLSND